MVCPLSSLTYSHIFLFSLVLLLCMSLSDVPFVYTDLQNAFEKMHSAIKENDLYAKVTRWELLLVLSGVVEIHFLIYLAQHTCPMPPFLRSPRTWIRNNSEHLWASLVAQMVKNPPTMQETSFHPWIGKIPRRKKRQPTPVFLPGESYGQRSLVGYSPWDHKESDMMSN